MRKSLELHNRARGDFAKDEKGAVTIILGLSIVPLLLASGLAADYALLQSAKTRMDAASDAAVLAGIKAAQTTYAQLSAINPNPGPQAIAAGLAQAEKSFYAQAGKRAGDLLGKPNISLNIKGQEVTGAVTYAAQTPSNFGKIAGIRMMNYSGAAGATLSMPKFLDFYMLLDVSGSMGLPSTPAGEAALAAISPDERAHYPTGCRFACHFPGSQGFSLSRTNNIQLRIDAVGAAVAQLMATAKDTEIMPKQFRMGVYPFIDHVNSFVDLTDDLRGGAYSVERAINYDPVKKTTDFGRLLDLGSWTTFARDMNPNYRANPKIPADTAPIGAGGTHIDVVFNEINDKITSVGDGSGATKGLPFVFFVSDGMQNSQQYTGWWWGMTTDYPTPPGQAPSVRAMDPAACQKLKDRGVTVAVLEIPYPAFTNPKTFGAYQELKANDAQPHLPTAMEACASKDFYFSATTPDEITASLKGMFAKAVDFAAARLTN